MNVRLNGWHVIGVVLSIVWFVGFAGWGWNDSIGEIRHTFTKGLNDCYRNWRPSDGDYATSMERWAQLKQCVDREGVSFEREFETNKRSIPILLAIDLLTVIFAWLMVWVIARIVRWVRRLA